MDKSSFPAVVEDFSTSISGISTLFDHSLKDISSFLSDRSNFESIQQSVSFLKHNWNEVKQYALIGAKGSHKELLETAERLRTEMDNLSKANLKIATLEKNISTQNVENAKLTLENIELQKQIEEILKDATDTSSLSYKLREKISSLERTIENNRNKLDEQQSLLSSSEAEKFSIQQSLQKQQSQNQLLSKKVEEGSLEVEELKKKNSDYADEVKNLKRQMQSLQKANEELTTEKRGIENKIKVVENKNELSSNSLSKQLQQLTNEKQQIDLKLSKTKNKMKELESDNEQMKELVRELKNEMDASKQKIAELEDSPNKPNIVELTRQIDHMKEEMGKLVQDREKAADELNMKRAQITQLQNKCKECEKVSSTNNERSSQYFSIFLTINKRINDLSSKIQEFNLLCLKKASSTDERVKKLIIDTKKSVGDQKRIISNYQTKLNNSGELLVYALDSFRKLSGLEDEASPSVSHILQDPDIFKSIVEKATQSINDVRSYCSQSMSSSLLHHSKTVSSLNTSVESMSSLLQIIGQQMEAEHKELMNSLGDVDAPSFRSAVSQKI